MNPKYSCIMCPRNCKCNRCLGDIISVCDCKCFSNGCLKDTTSMCDCNGVRTFCCTKHAGIHIQQGLDHNIKTCVKVLNNGEKENLIEFSKKTMIGLNKLEGQIEKRTCEIIKQTIELSNSAFRKIRETQAILNMLIISAVNKNYVNTELYRMIENKSVSKIPGFFSIKSTLGPFFQFEALVKIPMQSFNPPPSFAKNFDYEVLDLKKPMLNHSSASVDPVNNRKPKDQYDNQRPQPYTMGLKY